MKLIERVKAIQILEKDIKIPWAVQRLGLRPSLFGDQIVLTKDANVDYASVDEVREAVTWLAEQFDGKVKWSKK